MGRALRPHWTLHFAESAVQAVAMLAEVQLDLAIIDVGLPGDDGFMLVKLFAAHVPAMPLVLISGRDDAAVRIRARACGVLCFIAKSEPPHVIANAIDGVLAGTSQVDTGVAQLPKLTVRQTQVLMLLAAGHSNKEIRHRLDIAERTVRAHLTELFQLLGAHSRMQALVRAKEMGLIL